MDEKPDIEAVLQFYGADTYGAGSGWHDVKCPFHGGPGGERTASARINIQEGKFRCFACDIAGDSIDLIMAREGLGFGDACKWARDHVGYEGRSVRQAAPERYRPSWQEDDD